MAGFLEQNSLSAETEQVYQRAIAQFQDHSWQHKLARWYLRQRKQTDVARLSRDVIRIFSGTELESYFNDVVGSQAPLGPTLYLQLNLAAHQRFPYHLSFVRNLLNALSTAPTRDDAAYEAILRQHWYDAPDLRQRFSNACRSGAVWMRSFRSLAPRILPPMQGDGRKLATRAPRRYVCWPKAKRGGVTLSSSHRCFRR